MEQGKLFTRIIKRMLQSRQCILAKCLNSTKKQTNKQKPRTVDIYLTGSCLNASVSMASSCKPCFCIFHSSSDGQIVEETPLNSKYSVKEFVKVLDEKYRQVCESSSPH